MLAITNKREKGIHSIHHHLPFEHDEDSVITPKYMYESVLTSKYVSIDKVLSKNCVE